MLFDWEPPKPLSDHRDFSHFFIDISDEKKSPFPRTRIHKKDAKQQYVGTHLQVDGGADTGIEFTYFRVQPSKWAIRLAEESMIAIDYDEVYFKLIVFKDEATLYLQYNQIIGSRLLATLDLNTLPVCIQQHIHAVA